MLLMTSDGARSQRILMTSENLDIQPRKLYWKFALINLDPYETSRDTDTAVLHRISISFMWADWFGLGSP